MYYIVIIDFSETAKVNKQVLRHVIQLSTHIEYNFVLY